VAINPSASSLEDSILLAHPEALTEPEKLLAAYFSSKTVGLCILDSELRYIAINHALAGINGIPAADHMGKTLRETLGDFADLVEPKVREVLSTGEAVNFEISGTLPGDSEPGHWIGHYIPIKNEADVVTRVGAIVVEITAQKKLEKSLHHAGQKLNGETNRLQMLMEISSLLSSNWDLQKVFPQISARIRRVLHQELSCFDLHDASSGLLVRQAMDFPLGKSLALDVFISASNSPAGHALEARKPMIFSKEQLKSFDTEITNGILAEGLKTLCCVPLLRPNGPVGVLVLGSTRKNAFHPDDLTLLDQVAAQFAIALENHRAAAEIDALKRRLSIEQKFLQVGARSEGQFKEIIGTSPALRQVLDQVAIVATSEATVLILGETGTGKELVAHAIHRMSTRHDGPFVKLNCAAIPTGLLESELFGHEKGAFTGAISQKVGRMELAHGGTLFLDEVGEIPLELQPKLLRVLQDQEFERLGGTRTIKVSFRLIAATNRDLVREVADHQFRTDLYYRINVFPVRVPPLRERPDDIPLLVRYFVQKFALRMNRQIESIPTETIAALTEWPWPGNVRELENLMERSVILSEGPALRVPLAELHAESRGVLPQPDHTLDNAEREHILRILRETGGVLSGTDGAAHRLGLKRTTLQSKMLRLKIFRRDYFTPHKP
jgi:formate hydrogenlyase transcriptional activator